MGPAKKVEKYDLKGTIGEMIKYSEGFRQNMLMEARHLQDRVGKLINLCTDMSEFLDEHMIVREKIRKSKVLELKKLIKEYRKGIKVFRKARKAEKKSKVKDKILNKIKKLKVKRDKLKKKLNLLEPKREKRGK